MTDGIDWEYRGVFPNNAETQGTFWGYRGIRAYTGNPYPQGTLSAESTAITTPGRYAITCTAVNTVGYSWQSSTDGTTWADVPDEYLKRLTGTYLLGSHGTYHYRALCYGWLGTYTTAPLTITVTEPQISVYLTATETEIEIDGSIVISRVITPYPEYAKSYVWQSSEDGITWTDMAGVTETYTYAGSLSKVGIHYFRILATQYDDVVVESAPLAITVKAPLISAYLTTTSTELGYGESATISGFITPYPEYAKSYVWQSSEDGITWTDMPGVTDTYTLTATLADIGVHSYRMQATRYDDVVVTSNTVIITVNAPQISVSMTTTASVLDIGESATISRVISPSISYAKSYIWQHSTDGTTWTDMPGVTDTYTLTATLADIGQALFRVQATQYDDVVVESAPLTITVQAPQITSVTMAATQTSILIGGTSDVTCTITPELAAQSYVWQSSTDGTTWAGMVVSGLSYQYTGTVAGTVYFRVRATQYDDVVVESAPLDITVTEPELEPEPDPDEQTE